jgi:hypothetical protein
MDNHSTVVYHPRRFLVFEEDLSSLLMNSESVSLLSIGGHFAVTDSSKMQRVWKYADS